MRACAHACMHVRMYACTHVCVYACMRVCVYACMRVCVFVCVIPLFSLCLFLCSDVTEAGSEAQWIRCPTCNENFAEKGTPFSTHVNACNGLPPGIARAPDPPVTVDKKSYIGDLLWRNSFFKAVHKRTRMGDGHRLCRTLNRYMLVDYATSNSTNYLPESIRSLLQTDSTSGLYSPAMAQKIMFERFVNRKGGQNNIDIDLANEYDNRDIKPAIKHLGENHAKAEAKRAVRRKRTFMSIRRAQFESIGARKLLRARKVRTRKQIMGKVPALVRRQKFYESPDVLMTKVTQDDKFCIRPMHRLNFFRTNATIVRELQRNEEWSIKRRDSHEIDLAYLESVRRQEVIKTSSLGERSEAVDLMDLLGQENVMIDVEVEEGAESDDESDSKTDQASNGDETDEKEQHQRQQKEQKE
jgi:hypothetical protein